MLGWFQAIMPKEDKFFDLFEQHAALVVAGAEALRSLLKGGDAVENCRAQILSLENQADEVARQVLTAVRRLPRGGSGAPCGPNGRAGCRAPRYADG